MDASTQAWLMPVIVFAFGLFAAGMYLYRKYTAGESFEATKFLQTLGLGGLAALVLYFASAAVPDVDSVITYIETLAPGGVPSMSVILAALLAVWNGISKKTATSTISTATEQAATTEQAKSSLATPAVATSGSVMTAEEATKQAWTPGIKITPTFSKGASPMPFVLTAEVGVESPEGKRCKLQIDWMDGSPLEIVAPDQQTGTIVVPHTYTYRKGTTQYTGHSFYPEFTLLSSDGIALQVFNVEGKGCEVEVQSA